MDTVSLLLHLLTVSYTTGIMLQNSSLMTIYGKIILDSWFKLISNKLIMTILQYYPSDDLFE